MSQTEQTPNHKLSGVLWRVVGVLLGAVALLIGLVWGDLKSDNKNVRDDIRSIREMMTTLDSRIGNLEVHVRALQANREEAWTTAEHIRYDTELDEWRLDFERRLTRMETQKESQ